MKVSLNWLKKHVDLPPEATPEEIAKRLTFSGLEVEAVTNRAKGLEKVVVGEILERKPHPDADRLSLTKINVGGGEPLGIVCGAKNIAAGQKIPVAVVGALIPNGLEIKAAKIRGQSSSGMLCSLDELLLPKDWQAEDGIFILDPKAKVGTPFAEYLGFDDWILTLNVTPNRGDALSHIGVAREVAALFGVSLKTEDVKFKEQPGGKYPVEIVNSAGKDLCPSYFGRLIENVKVGPSPKWLKNALESVGIRSHNNVVDITNYVLFEAGQPLHAFDAEKIAHGGKIRINVRKAKAKEKFHTLSDKVVDLVPEDLVIAAGSGDGEAVALAGVMGGKDSEVSDSTTTVFLEAAEFNSSSVRKTSRRLGLLSDAAYRYERGIDSARVQWAMDLACYLFQEHAGGKVHKVFMAPGSDELPSASVIRLRVTEAERLLGKAPSRDQTVAFLRAEGIHAEITAGESDVVEATVPYWRKDLKTPVDLIEEVARLWGYDKLSGKLPLAGIGEREPKGSKRGSYFLTRRVRRHLASLGFFEALNYGFTSHEKLEKLGITEKNLVEIVNPVSLDYAVMKPTLVTGLLENLQKNFAHRKKDLRLFEVRRTFVKSEAPQFGDDKRLETHVEERIKLSMAVTGAEIDENWQGKASPVSFYSLKGVLESVFQLLGAGGLQFRAADSISFLHPGQTAEIVRGNRVLGVMGKLHPKVEKKFEFEQDVFVAEIDLQTLLSEDMKLVTFKEFSHFPTVERDFSALVKDSITADQMKQAVLKLAKPLVKSVTFFDVYKGSRVPEGHVSYAFRVVLGSDSHTLTDEEIHKTQESVMKGLEKEFSARFAGL